MSRTLTNDKRVDEVQRDGDGYFIYLKYGLTLEEPQNGEGCHCFGADTVAEARQILATAYRCTCTSCTEHENKNKP